MWNQLCRTWYGCVPYPSGLSYARGLGFISLGGGDGAVELGVSALGRGMFLELHLMEQLHQPAHKWFCLAPDSSLCLSPGMRKQHLGRTPNFRFPEEKIGWHKGLSTTDYGESGVKFVCHLFHISCLWNVFPHCATWISKSLSMVLISLSEIWIWF